MITSVFIRLEDIRTNVKFLCIVSTGVKEIQLLVRYEQISVQRFWKVWIIKFQTVKISAVSC